MRDRFLDDCLIYEILFVAEEIPNETGEVKQEQQVLSSHRKDLLDALHACQTAWTTWHGRLRRKRGEHDGRPSDSGNSHRSVVRCACRGSGERCPLVWRWQRERGNLSYKKFYNSLKQFLSNSSSPSLRILLSSFDIALRSTKRKSASCWRLNGIVKLELFCRVASSDK